MIQKRGRPTNTWAKRLEGFAAADSRSKGDLNTRLRAQQGVQGSHTLGMRLHTSAEQLLTLPLQLNINGLQEALSCYSMLVKYSLMHIHTHSFLTRLYSAFILLGALTTP